MSDETDEQQDDAGADEQEPISDWLKRASPDTATCQVFVNRDLAAELRDALDELNNAIGENGDTDDAPELAQRCEDIRARIEAETRTFKFRSIGHRAWRDLLAQHPPKSAHKKMGVDHDPEKFPQSAIAASCVEPKLTVEDVKEIERFASEQQWSDIWTACLNANVVGEIPKSDLPGRILRARSGSGSTASSTASPAASS